MREAIDRKNIVKGNYIVIALFVSNRLVGWAMLDFVLSQQSSMLRCYIYVKEQYRRKGYGTLILQKTRLAAKRRGRGIRVCPWDVRSRKFFQSVNVTKNEVAQGYTL